MLKFFFFFFSSRRRHTRSDRDWSSDVCSSDLDDPHPRNNYWDMWGLPMFGLADPAGALREINECREVYPDRYIKVSAYDARQGRQTVALSFFFSSRRRHTRSDRDWSSDVCSSDLDLDEAHPGLFAAITGHIGAL